MLCMANGLFVVFWDADWYRYLWISKGFRGADFAAFWQDDQGLKLIKFSSKSWISQCCPHLLFSMYRKAIESCDCLRVGHYITIYLVCEAATAYGMCSDSLSHKIVASRSKY